MTQVDRAKETPGSADDFEGLLGSEDWHRRFVGVQVPKGLRGLTLVTIYKSSIRFHGFRIYVKRKRRPGEKSQEKDLNREKPYLAYLHIYTFHLMTMDALGSQQRNLVSRAPPPPLRRLRPDRSSARRAARRAAARRPSSAPPSAWSPPKRWKGGP